MQRKGVIAIISHRFCICYVGTINTAVILASRVFVITHRLYARVITQTSQGVITRLTYRVITQPCCCVITRLIKGATPTTPREIYTRVNTVIIRVSRFIIRHLYTCLYAPGITSDVGISRGTAEGGTSNYAVFFKVFSPRDNQR